MKTTFSLAILTLAIAGCGGNTDTPAQTLGEALTALQARVDSGTMTATDASSIARRWVLHDLNARVAVGSMTADQAADAKGQLVNPGRVTAEGQKQRELTWFQMAMIITRAFSLSGDTCPTCDLLTWPIDFGTGGTSGGGWDDTVNNDAH